MVAACVMTFEARDSAAKVTPARPQVSYQHYLATIFHLITFNFSIFHYEKSIHYRNIQFNNMSFISKCSQTGTGR